MQDETSHIGARKESGEDRIISYVMEAMPVPRDWGIQPAIAKGRGHMCLVRGVIPFERLDISLADRIYVAPEPEEEEEPLFPPDLDPADKLLGKDQKRRILSRESDVDLFALERKIRGRLGRRGASSYDLLEDEQFAQTDYRSAKEIQRIHFRLEQRTNRLLFHVIELAAVTLFLGVIEMAPAFGLPFPDVFTPEGSPAVYLSLSLAGLLFGGYVAFRDITAGLRNLWQKKYNTRTVLAVAVTAELLHIVYMLVMSLWFGGQATNSFAAPVCFAVTIYTVNRLLHTVRIARGFGFAARRGIKSELLAAEDSPLAVDLRLASDNHSARVCYMVRTKRLAEYFKNACREDNCSALMSKLYPWLLMISAAAALIGAIRGALRGDSFAAVGFSALSAALVTSVPITGLLCLEIPLGLMSKRLLRKGALLNGWNAVQKFGDTDAFAINTTDLFPRGSIKVRKALAVGDMDIDEVTAAAASLIIASGGALAEVFSALIHDESALRDAADGLYYENEMGVSGFLRERRVLVGNRSMMETHRVLIPGGGLGRLNEFEDMVERIGQQVLYVAVNNKLVGVYLLEYKAVTSVRNALVQMISDGTNLMIYTCDANIDVGLITRVFDLPPRYISILDNESSRVYDAVTYAVTESEETLLATNGTFKALAAGIRAAVRLKETESLGILVQTICFGMGFLFVAVLSCISPYAIDAAQVLIMQVVFVIISLFSVLRAI